MQYPHDGQPWTSQHTRALFRLFQTSAPPDFQRQVLERVAQRQHARIRRRIRWRSPLSWWPGGRAWGGGTLQFHRRWPRRVIATAGYCGLVLGTSLVWWAWQTGPAVPSIPEMLVSRAIAPLPGDTDVPNETPIRVDHHGWFGNAKEQETAVRTASSPAPIDIAPQMPMGKAVDRSIAWQAGDNSERALLASAPVPHLTVRKERHPPARLHTHRPRRTRGAPGKVTRFHTRPGPGPQTRTALRQYQQHKGLGGTGSLDRQTLETLRIQ